MCKQMNSSYDLMKTVIAVVVIGESDFSDNTDDLDNTLDASRAVKDGNQKFAK